jgi:hypothetical protein
MELKSLCVNAKYNSPIEITNLSAASTYRISHLVPLSCSLDCSSIEQTTIPIQMHCQPSGVSTGIKICGCCRDTHGWPGIAMNLATGA